MSDIYRNGAARSLGVEEAEVSDWQRLRFKQAFFSTLHAYLYGIDQSDRDVLVGTIREISACVEGGKSLDETLLQLSALVETDGRGSRTSVH